MKIEIEYGETANAGNFESIRISCKLEEQMLMDNPTNKEIIEMKKFLYNKAKKFVQTKIIMELKERENA